MRGDLTAVKSLIKQGLDVGAAQGDGMTALHWAANHGDTLMTALLLGAKANLTAVTRVGAYTPLHIASLVGAAWVVAALLDAGADSKAITTTGVTALHLAAMSGSAAAIGALLDHGAEVNVKEPQWEQTPLMLAAAKGRASAVRVLLARGADHAITAKVVDLVALAATDRPARQRRNQVLAEYRGRLDSTAQRAWRPDARQVQDAVRASLVVERQPPNEATLASNAAATAAEVTGQAAAGGGGGDEDTAGYTEMVGFQGGMTALLLAVREGQMECVGALLDGGADVNQVSLADKTSPLLLATINGHYDLAKLLVERGANANLASDAGATPLYAVINKEWAPTSRTPQPAYHLQQKVTYLQLMQALLKAKADPNVRLKRSLWYTTYNRDNLRVDFKGATPFFRAAYATDVAAMRLLLAAGANPNIPTIRPPPRAPRPGADTSRAQPPRQDMSGLPPIPEGGPGIWPIHAASGVGYGQGYAANDHRHVPDGWLPSVKFLVEKLGADVNARDANGYTPLHFAAARGDNATIRYLVSKGADVTAVARNGQTTADMANGPVQRISPYLDTVALLEKLGATNNHKCVAC
jgi:ankyrin repeat protein